MSLPPPQEMAAAPALPPVIEPYEEALLEPALAEPVTSQGHAQGVPEINGAVAALVSAVAAAHREAVGAHVETLRHTSEARLALLRGVVRAGSPLSITTTPRSSRITADYVGTVPTPVSVATPPSSPRMGSLGPQFSREQLEVHASGQISSIFGPLFRNQDGYRRQVRMPMPPLLLPDRVTAMVGEAGSMQTGAVWTETDVRRDSWFLHENHVAPGILIEAGQAYLFLISWLGIDLLNRDERVYRLLGCELTFFGVLPYPGDTLSYEIHIDKQADIDDVRLFFFRFDCRVNGEIRLQLRNGQAGFFTDRELAQSAGVTWDPSSEKPMGDFLPIEIPVTPPFSYSRQQVRAFAEGDAFTCFGRGYELLATHTATPRIPAGRLQLIQEIAELDPRGGPWQRGYMRVRNKVSPSDWVFAAHFHDDPCMPGSLMAEAGTQAMSFYMTALGLTLERDGWRFEPIHHEVSDFHWHGQVVPTSRELTYEVFIHQVIAGPEPAMYADILGTVDGVTNVFYGHGVGMRLVPDWPLEKRPNTTLNKSATAGKAAIVNGFEFGADAMLASAIGRPSHAFGKMYLSFDGGLRKPRLPGPPFLFLSRVTRVDGIPESMTSGMECEVEYDVDPRAWYFDDNGVRRMPFCVLMEVALQPCGWLASYAGCASTSPDELYFRNLDGIATVHSLVEPDSGTLTTRLRLTSLSRSGRIILVNFDVETRSGDRHVFTMKTGLGFFPKSAFEAQAGLPATDEEQQIFAVPSDFHVDLKSNPPRFFGGPARLANGKLLMLDRVTGYWPHGGTSGLGRLRAEKDIDVHEWFFKAHFFQDPVMPGSLGIESMIQLLELFMLEARLDEGFDAPFFEAPATGHEISWRYRGQVVPVAGRITVEMEIREILRGKCEITAIADAWLWIDRLRIYQAQRVSARLVSRRQIPQRSRIVEIAPHTDPWVLDHRPNFITPVLPMMYFVSVLAQAASEANPGRLVTTLHDVSLRGWGLVDQPRRFRAISDTNSNVVSARVEMQQLAHADRFDPIATAHAILSDSYPVMPAPLPELRNAAPSENPYHSASLFHGPAFQVLRRLHSSDEGATAILDAAAGGVSSEFLPVALLDGALHAVPNDEPEKWWPSLAPDRFLFPRGLSHITFHSPVPSSGLVRCEARCDGMGGGPGMKEGHATEGAKIPAVRIQIYQDDVLWADLRCLYTLVPKGPIGKASRLARRAFLRDLVPHPSISLSRSEHGKTRLEIENVRQSDWLPGMAATVFRASGRGLLEVARQIAIKEHIASLVEVHAANVTVAPNEETAGCQQEPLRVWPVSTETDETGITVTEQQPFLDFAPVLSFWRGSRTSSERAYKVLTSLSAHFVKRIRLEDPAAILAFRGKPVFFMGNHQTLLEPILFSFLAPALTGSPLTAIAKVEQKQSQLIQTTLRVLGTIPELPVEPIVYFDQRDPESMLTLTQHLQEAISVSGRSVLVHVEGARKFTCREPVRRISSALLELAIAANIPILPVRFIGALPIHPVPEKLDLPIGLGSQDYWIGKPILPEMLRQLSLVERKALVLGAINTLGIPNQIETPNPPDKVFASAVARRMETAGIGEVDAVLLECAGMDRNARIYNLFRD